MIFTFARTNGCLAQLVEQWTVNPCVAGSKPAAAVIRTSQNLGSFFCLKRFTEGFESGGSRQEVYDRNGKTCSSRLRPFRLRRSFFCLN